MSEIKIEKWGIFEWSGKGYSDKNPFKDYHIEAEFKSAGETKKIRGFYDGDGVYKVRFMPSFEGEYTYKISGSFSEEEHSGSFIAEAPSANNHGAVRVKGIYHFAYDDGTPYYSIGTTCYVWELQNDERIEETFKSLEESGFNKIRFCIFPKHYDYNLAEPRSYPYVGTPVDNSDITSENFLEYTGKTEGNNWDFYRFNPEHFRHIEKCIGRLCKMGIEADIIVFHPYDRWGFCQMTRDEDIFYIRYLISRLSAYRNVWWAMANEYDLFEHKNSSDWDYIGNLFKQEDPYDHLRSIHNCIDFYDHKKEWITHCSIQRQDLYRTTEFTDEWREIYKKPIVLDEIAYEGNIEFGWGNITGEELLRRFWEGALRGGYPGHGETYLNEAGVLWWSHGGKLKGESHARFKFLHKIMCETPGLGLKRDSRDRMNWDCVMSVPEDIEEARRTGYRIYYYSFMRPSFRCFDFKDNSSYKVEVIDTWNMTITDAGVHSGKFRIALPGRQYMAIRMQKV
ncbi:MAG: DUF5605 domain-containing protein [Lachnospiraceae bacterium]|nr:DUF5605 domain-containing protein [Lachnospiraceae bacterium]